MKSPFNKIIVIAFIFAFACNKKNDTVPATPSGTLGFHIHTNVDANEVGDFGKVYTLGYGSNAGRKITVTQAQLLISNIKAISSNGTNYNISGKIIHKVQPTDDYFVGNVPIGNYNSVSYTIGLDPVTNMKVPTLADTALYDPSLWYVPNAASIPTNGGYIFIDFEGTIDTSASKNGSTMTPFNYKIGVSTNAVSITLPNQAFTIVQNQVQFVHMIINYAALLNNIPLDNPSNLNVNTPADNNSSVVSIIKNNMNTGAKGQTQSFISYEE